MIVILAFIITYSVIMRYVFNDPDPFTYDLSSIILLVSVVLTVPALEILDQNIRMDMVVTYIPAKPRHLIMRVFGPLLALYYVGILAWKGWVNALYSLRLGETSTSPWGQPLAPIKFMIPIGYGLLFLVLIITLVRGIAVYRNVKADVKPAGSAEKGVKE
jgi:TRAP-type C4-dicarboxylate transport system permease small subunit